MHSSKEGEFLKTQSSNYSEHLVFSPKIINLFLFQNLNVEKKADNDKYMKIRVI